MIDRAGQLRLLEFVDGRLTVHEWGSGPWTVVAVHGITANALSFGPLAQALRGTARVLAPDLRGRACSASLVGGGLARHAADVIEVAEQLAPTGPRSVRPVLLGHSMGGYVARLAAAARPDLWHSVVLLDGGITPSGGPWSGPGSRPDLAATLGPALARLEMEFAGLPQYLEFWQTHPAVGRLLRGPTGPAVVDYLGHDLVRAGRSWRSSCDRVAVEVDGAQVLDPAALRAAALETTVLDTAVPGPAVVPPGPPPAAGPDHPSTTLLLAERGLLDQPEPFLSDDAVRSAALQSVEHLERVSDTNHYSLLMGRLGVIATVGSLVRNLRG